MSFYGAVKVTDIYGNVVELSNVDELLEGIRNELKLIRLQLESMTDNQITKEDIEDVD